MEKERKVKTLSLVALIVAVLGLTVAFAALSQTLTINGTANVEAAEWDVHIENLHRTRVDGSAEVISEPTIGSDGKSIENFNVSLKKPGDSVRYDFVFKNSGTIDAVLSKIINSGYDDTLYGDIEEGSAEEQEIYTNLVRKMFPKADWNGDGITTDEERFKADENIRFYTDNYSIKNLNAGKGSACYIEVSYISSSTELPKGEVEVNLKDEYIFVQK